MSGSSTGPSRQWTPSSTSCTTSQPSRRRRSSMIGLCPNPAIRQSRPNRLPPPPRPGWCQPPEHRRLQSLRSLRLRQAAARSSQPTRRRAQPRPRRPWRRISRRPILPRPPLPCRRGGPRTKRFQWDSQPRVQAARPARRVPMARRHRPPCQLRSRCPPATGRPLNPPVSQPARSQPGNRAGAPWPAPGRSMPRLRPSPRHHARAGSRDQRQSQGQGRLRRHRTKASRPRQQPNRSLRCNGLLNRRPRQHLLLPAHLVLPGHLALPRHPR